MLLSVAEQLKAAIDDEHRVLVSKARKMLSEDEKKFLDVRMAILEAGGLDPASLTTNTLQLSDEAQAEIFRREIELAAPITASMAQSVAVIHSHKGQSLGQASATSPWLANQAESTSLKSQAIFSVSADSGGSCRQNLALTRQESLQMNKEERKRMIQEKLAAKRKRDELEDSAQSRK